MAGSKENVDLVFRAFDRASPKIRKLERRLTRTNKKMGGVGKMGGRAASGMARFGIGAKGASAAASIMSSGVAAAGVAILAVAAIAAATAVVLTVKLTRAFKTSHDAAVEFQHEMAKVNTMLDVGEEKLLPAFTKQVDLLARQFGQSTATISKGLFDILSAGIDSSEAIGVLEQSLVTATAGIVDTEIAADALTTVLNSYNVAAKDAAQVSDILFQLVKEGKLEFADVAQGIGSVAAMAFTAGVSLNDLAAGIATMTRGGIKAEQVFTTMRTILGSMLNPSAEARVELKKLGIEFSSTELRTKGLANVIEELGRATPEQLAKMFPKRGLPGISKLIDDVKGLRQDTLDMRGASGAAAEAYKKMASTSKFQLAQLKQEFLSVARAIGEDLLPMGLAMVKVIKEQIVPRLREWGTWLSKIVGGFDNVILKFGELIAKWEVDVAVAFARMKVFWENLPDVIRIAVLGGIRAIVKFALDVKHWFDFTEELLNFFFDNWTDTWNAVVKGLSTVLTNMGDNLTKFWGAIGTFLVGGGFKFDWTPLGDGLVLELEKMPSIVKRGISETEAAFDLEIGTLTTGMAEKLIKAEAEARRKAAEHAKSRAAGVNGAPPGIVSAFVPAIAGLGGINIPGSGARGTPGPGITAGGAGTTANAAIQGRLLTAARFIAQGQRRQATASNIAKTAQETTKQSALLDQIAETLTEISNNKAILIPGN